jgi:hypothetical protein
LTQNAYLDLRRDFWKSCYQEASTYDDYLAQSEPRRAEKWTKLSASLPPLSEEQRARLTGYRRELHVLLVSGVWCGDCVRQGPMIRQIVDACDEGVALKVIDRDQNEALRDEVRILGALRVPVLVFLSEDFFEVGRFGDRMLTTYRRKAASELGPACPVPGALVPQDELRSERDEWVDVFERMLLMVRLAPPLRQRHGD